MKEISLLSLNHLLIIYLHHYELKIFILFFGSKFNAIVILLVKLFKLWPLVLFPCPSPSSSPALWYFPIFWHCMMLQTLLVTYILLFFWGTLTNIVDNQGVS